MLAPARAREHLERVEREAVLRRVDLGGRHVELHALEEARDAREEAGLVGRVHEHLQAFAGR
ncbi:hypothetical protein D3C83_39620 [compost metagenome]